MFILQINYNSIRTKSQPTYFLLRKESRQRNLASRSVLIRMLVQTYFLLRKESRQRNFALLGLCEPKGSHSGGAVIEAD